MRASLTAASSATRPPALVSAQSVMIPVSGSIARCALNPSWRRCTRLVGVARLGVHRGDHPVRGHPLRRSATVRRCHQSPRPVRRPDRRSAPATPPPQPPWRRVPARADNRAAGAHHRPERRSAHHGPSCRPRRSPVCPHRRSHGRCSAARSPRPPPGTSRRTRRIAPTNWVTVSWVATASSSTVESNARRVFPASTPGLRHHRSDRLEDPVRPNPRPPTAAANTSTSSHETPPRSPAARTPPSTADQTSPHRRSRYPTDRATPAT